MDTPRVSKTGVFFFAGPAAPSISDSDSGHWSKRAKVSHLSFAEGAGDSGLMEIASAANAEQKPPECLTTVLLRERSARLAGQAPKDAQIE